MTKDNHSKNTDLPDFYSGQNYVIEESVGYMIRQAQLALHRTIDSKMAALDLTAMQWGPLLLIGHGKARTAADLSRCGGVETSTMTRMLDRLESKGLIIRKRSESDRRIIFLELTDEGKRLVSEVPNLLAESLNQHLRGFNQQELDTLKSLLKRFTVNPES
ncbi:MAG TPA: MarR family transcriptional regulator [Methylophilaceae bacterium]|jgi:DNA-binding MarR family transcriptional regulator